MGHHSARFERTLRCALDQAGFAARTNGDVHAALGALVTAIREEVAARGEVRIPGLGVFRKATRKARRVVVPETCGDGTFIPRSGSARVLPMSRSIRFTPATAWKETLK